MRRFFITHCFLGFVVMFLIGRLPAQQASSSRDTDSTPSVSSSPAASAPSASHSVPSVSYAGSGSGSYGVSGSRDRDFYSGGSGSGGGGGYVPNYTQYINPYTSFWSYESYERANLLFHFLRYQYPGVFSTGYFSRYYNNNEPIITSQTAIAMRIPSANSRQLVTIADRLQAIRTRYASQGQADRMMQDPEVRTLIQSTKMLARQIYKYPPMEYLDVGKTNKPANLSSSKDMDSSFEQLDSLIRMLQNQFHAIWESENPSLVSVDQLSQPSPVSLAKGIEKLADRLAKTAGKS